MYKLKCEKNVQHIYENDTVYEGQNDCLAINDEIKSWT